MRASLTHLTRNKTLLGGLVAAIVLALVGTAAAYATMSRTVTVSVDGKESQVRTFGDNVGEVLASKGIKPDSHDSVVPGVDTPVNDGSRIAVRIGRPLALSIDGEKRTVWTTATKVATALDQVGVRFGNAALSVSRSADIDRSGMALEVTTPKQVALKVADDQGREAQRPRRRPWATCSPRSTPGSTATTSCVPRAAPSSTDGTRVVVTKIGTRTKRVPREIIPASVTEQKDDSMMEGETETVREGSDGVRDVTYKVRFRNGEVVKRSIVKQHVLERAGRQDRQGRHQDRRDPVGQLRRRRHGLGRDRRVRVRRQLGRQHRQRLLRRAAVQPRHLGVLRRLGHAAREQPRAADRRRRARRRRRGRLRRLAALRCPVRLSPAIASVG